MKISVDLSGAPRHIQDGLEALINYGGNSAAVVPYDLFSEACRIADGCTRAVSGDPVHASFFGYCDQQLVVGKVVLHRPTPAAATLIAAAGEWPIPLAFAVCPSVWALLVQAYALANATSREALMMASDYRQASRLIPGWAMQHLADCSFGELSETIGHLQVAGFPERIESPEMAQKKTLGQALIGLEPAACSPAGAADHQTTGSMGFPSKGVSGRSRKSAGRIISRRKQKQRR